MEKIKKLSTDMLMESDPECKHRAKINEIIETINVLIRESQRIRPNDISAKNNEPQPI